MNVTEQISISLITTCKGRLSYLKENIQSWCNLNYDNYDIVVVDYDDPDGSGQFVEYNKEKYLKNKRIKDIKTVKIKNKPMFNLNDARNIGIENSNSKLVFLIDSDIKIIDKDILKKINSMVGKGVLFFSNLQILNSNYFEAICYYNLKFGINIHNCSILPIAPLKPDITGTVCFFKDLYEKCGKFNYRINENGFGWDEFEFYLRYLNQNLSSIFLGEKEKIKERLDRQLLNYYTFPQGTFAFQLNKREEKDKFYKKKMEESHLGNMIFLKTYFDKLNTPSIFNQISDILELIESNNNFALFNSTIIPINPWFTAWMHVWMVNKMFLMGEDKKMKFFLERLSRFSINQDIYSSIFQLYKIASLFKTHNFLEVSKKLFNKIIEETDNQEILPGAYFHLGAIYKKQNNNTKALKYFDKCLKLNTEHKMAKKMMENIEDNAKRNN